MRNKDYDYPLFSKKNSFNFATIATETNTAMRNIYSTIVALTAIINILAACSTKENGSVLLPELAQAEAIMYEHPDSALHILQGMQIPNASQKLEHATWALLITQAKYKTFMEQLDSLINIAYDYFMKQDGEERKALILYLKGGICHEKQDIENAQKFLLEAADYAEKTDNYRLCYLTNNHLGHI